VVVHRRGHGRLSVCHAAAQVPAPSRSCPPSLPLPGSTSFQTQTWAIGAAEYRDPSGGLEGGRGIGVGVRGGWVKGGGG